MVDLELRSVGDIYDAIKTFEGAGFMVNRPFPNTRLDYFDPFLLLDEMGPADLAPGEARGAPDHPHRGFETVTYILEGAFQHKDSHGNMGNLRPGDVQWMTAGSGVVHSEMPAAHIMRDGGRMHGFQLWVNLPEADKLIPPRYQDTDAHAIPEITSDDGKVWAKVIAGSALGADGVIETRIPITYVHFRLSPGSSVDQHVSSDHNAFCYVVSSMGVFGSDDTTVRAGQMVTFHPNGDAVHIAAAESATEALDVLLLAGEPLREPVARYGPFVMNTRDEIVQAVEDFQSGRMGEIKV